MISAHPNHDLHRRNYKVPKKHNWNTLRPVWLHDHFKGHSVIKKVLSVQKYAAALTSVYHWPENSNLLQHMLYLQVWIGLSLFIAFSIHRIRTMDTLFPPSLLNMGSSPATWTTSQHLMTSKSLSAPWTQHPLFPSLLLPHTTSPYTLDKCAIIIQSRRCKLDNAKHVLPRMSTAIHHYADSISRSNQTIASSLHSHQVCIISNLNSARAF